MKKNEQQAQMCSSVFFSDVVASQHIFQRSLFQPNAYQGMPLWDSNGGDSALTIGKYAKKKFTELLNSGKLTKAQLDDLMDKDYCRNEFQLQYPVVVNILSNSFDNKRFYTGIVLGKYRICSQWYDRHRDIIDKWFLKLKI